MFRVILITAAVALSVSSLASPGFAEVLVTVNGEELTDGDLEFLFLSRRIPVDQREVVRERYIEMLIDRALLKQFLKSRRISASQLVVDQHVARVEKLIQREGLDMDAVLKSLGYTRNSFREEVALPLTWKRHASLTITKQALERFWERQKPRFDGTEVRASQIVKKIPGGASPGDIAELKKQLADLRDEIVAGKSTFAEAAKEHSDSPSKRKGGDLGQFPYSGKMPTEITRVAFALKEGEISNPFQTRFGMHLLMVTDIEPGDLTLEDARPELFEFLAEELRQKLVQQMRAEAKIERAG